MCRAAFEVLAQRSTFDPRTEINDIIALNRAETGNAVSQEAYQFQEAYLSH
jgi:hypothetical protein